MAVFSKLLQASIMLFSQYYYCAILLAFTFPAQVSAFSPLTISSKPLNIASTSNGSILLRPTTHYLHHYSAATFRSFLLSSSSTPNDGYDQDNWGDDDDTGSNDPRVDALRSILEASWDGDSMGVVPTTDRLASEAAAESVALAMGQGHNILMIDLRLPSYDITEGPKLYDIYSAYKFCSFLSERLIERNLIRKSLVLVRNERERAEIGRALKAKGELDGGGVGSNKNSNSNSQSASNGMVGGEVGGAKEESSSSDVDDFRQKLMSSWDSIDGAVSSSSSSSSSDNDATTTATTNENENNSISENNINFKSHRLWSMVANEQFTSGPDMFDQVIAAVDQHARLAVDGQSSEPEDALILLSPYDTTDVIAIRRILARYGQTRTIILVNSRMENIPQELDPAVLVYGIMPLIARARNSGDDDDDDTGLGTEAGPKVVVMKRFPRKWSVFLDVNEGGFVDVTGNSPSGAEGSKTFPPIEWIVGRVQEHIQKLSG